MSKKTTKITGEDCPAASSPDRTLLEAESKTLMRALIRKAQAGNIHALRLCLERLIPVTRERALPLRVFPSHATETALQITAAMRKVIDALGDGRLTPGEAQKLAAILENQRKAIETGALEDAPHSA